jgi:hypothetical protein
MWHNSRSTLIHELGLILHMMSDSYIVSHTHITEHSITYHIPLSTVSKVHMHSYLCIYFTVKVNVYLQ